MLGFGQTYPVKMCLGEKMIFFFYNKRENQNTHEVLVVEQRSFRSCYYFAICWVFCQAYVLIKYFLQAQGKALAVLLAWLADAAMPKHA
jgi:hypothetical protein